MTNPVTSIQRTVADYKTKDAKDKRRFWWTAF